MKHILQHPARFIPFLLVAGTIGLLLLMHAHSNSQPEYMRGTPAIRIIKLI